jgi:hypothetical protein
MDVKPRKLPTHYHLRFGSERGDKPAWMHDREAWFTGGEIVRYRNDGTFSVDLAVTSPVTQKPNLVK